MTYGVWYAAPAYDIVEDSGWCWDDDGIVTFPTIEDAEAWIVENVPAHDPFRWCYQPRVYDAR